MFDCEIEKRKEIIEYNESIKKKIKEQRELEISNNFGLAGKLTKLREKGIIKLIKNRIDILTDDRLKDEILVNRKYKVLDTAINNREDTNYFSNERIAVYTCIFGEYDEIIEPQIKPDNIDYYIITNKDIPSTSAWKKIDVENMKEINGLSNGLKNRYFKMHPHFIFKDYKYSIYVDGNFEIHTDLTEHVNRLSNNYFGLFRHCQRKCVFEEFDACRLLRKASEKELKEYEDKLIENKMPVNYGLMEAGMIVREHVNPACIKIMEDWWNEVSSNLCRDQITLPYVLFKNGIDVDKVAVLGNNIWTDLSFTIVDHNKKIRS